MVVNRWSVLALLSLARTAMAIQFQSVASVGPLLVGSFGLEYAELGTLIGLYMLPGVVIALPGGVLASRFGTKQLVLVGLVLMVAGGVIAGLSQELTGLVVGRLVSGAGAVLMNVLLTKMVADWFAGREIVTAMAIMISSWPLGLALALLALPPLAAAAGWQAVMYLVAAMCLVWLLAIALLYRDPPDAAAPAPVRLDLNLSRREWLLVSIAGAVWGLFNIGYIVLISFLPDLFAARGYSLAEASSLVSLLGWAMIVLIPAGGYLADSLSRPFLVMAASGLIVTLATAALPFMALPMAAFAVIVLMVGLPAGPLAALPAAALRPENRANGMGVAYTWFYVLMAGLPGLAGLARDMAQSPAAPVLFAAGAMLAATCGLGAYRYVARVAAPAR